MWESCLKHLLRVQTAASFGPDCLELTAGGQGGHRAGCVWAHTDPQLEAWNKYMMVCWHAEGTTGTGTGTTGPVPVRSEIRSVPVYRWGGVCVGRAVCAVWGSACVLCDSLWSSLFILHSIGTVPYEVPPPTCRRDLAPRDLAPSVPCAPRGGEGPGDRGPNELL
jgi:hypothetical protein